MYSKTFNKLKASKYKDERTVKMLEMIENWFYNDFEDEEDLDKDIETLWEQYGV